MVIVIAPNSHVAVFGAYILAVHSFLEKKKKSLLNEESTIRQRFGLDYQAL